MQPLEVLSAVYVIYEQSSAAPDPTSDDFAIRLSYLNRGISKWENETGVDWKELFVPQYSLSLDANGTVTLPSNFKKPASYLVVGSNRYYYVNPERFEEMVLQQGQYYYTITGIKGAFLLKTTPAAASQTATLDYYKYAWQSIIGQEAQNIEMSNPEFLIHDVLGQIYLQDQNMLQAQVEIQVGAGLMDAMIVDNMTNVPNNPLQETDDDFQGFGI